MSEQKMKKTRTVPNWLRIIWLILKALFVPVLCLGGLAAGLVLGYTYVGGQPASEIFDMGTWKHLYDLIFAK